MRKALATAAFLEATTLPKDIFARVDPMTAPRLVTFVSKLAESSLDEATRTHRSADGGVGRNRT